MSKTCPDCCDTCRWCEVGPEIDRGCVTETADAVVVGAGVIGASAAFELARTGRRVVVADMLPGPGQGSTSASSACVRFNYSTADGIAAAWEAHHHWAHWADHLEHPAGGGPLARLQQTGLVMLDVPGGDYWQRWAQFLREVVEPKGLVSPDDRSLFVVTDSVDEATDEIASLVRDFLDRLTTNKT